MDDLKVNDLEITVSDGDRIEIRWHGFSNFVKPGKVIDPYFEKLADSLRGKSVVIDFTDLTYMNSSTVSSIIQICKLFDMRHIQTVLRYDATSEWQSATFKGFETLARLIKSISVEPVGPSS